MALAPRARVDDPEKLADDANRSVAARKPLIPTSQLPAANTTPQPIPPNLAALRATPPVGVGLSQGVNIPTALPAIADPPPNIGLSQGVNIPTAFPDRDLSTVPADPPFHVGPQPTTAPFTGGFLSSNGPAAPAPVARGFTLDDLLSAAGPAQTGLGALASLGVGSSLVAQNNSEIDTVLGRERAQTEGIRAGQELESQIASRGAQADVATTSAEKIGAENRFNALRVAQGLSPISSGDTETFKTSVIDADIVSGTPAQLLRAGSRGGSELRPASEGGFTAAVTKGGQDPTAVRIAAIDGFKASNPQFKDATDQEVLNELQRQFDAQSAQ